ncbi:hypothetical protein GCM10020219_091080 [Nonomuraea dietziae]
MGGGVLLFKTGKTVKRVNPSASVTIPKVEVLVVDAGTIRNWPARAWHRARWCTSGSCEKVLVPPRLTCASQTSCMCRQPATSPDVVRVRHMGRSHFLDSTQN